MMAVQSDTVSMASRLTQEGIIKLQMFTTMLTDAFQDCDDGCPIRYHFDDKPFKLRSQIKVADKCDRWASLC